MSLLSARLGESLETHTKQWTTCFCGSASTLSSEPLFSSKTYFIVDSSSVQQVLEHGSAASHSCTCMDVSKQQRLSGIGRKSKKHAVWSPFTILLTSVSNIAAVYAHKRGFDSTVVRIWWILVSWSLPKQYAHVCGFDSKWFLEFGRF